MCVWCVCPRPTPTPLTLPPPPIQSNTPNTGESALSVSVTCKCGKCMVQIVDGEMRARAACFCTDCRQRFFAAAHAGGPAVPADVVDCSAGIDLQLYVF